MNPYTHHPSLSGSPHHAPGGPHHGYSTSGGGGGNGTTTTPDPSPHSPPYGNQPDSSAPYTSLQSGQGMGSNGHHHAQGNMMGDQPHHQGHSHPHLSGHLPYPPVNHNNNCTLKHEGGPGGPTGNLQCAGCGGRINERWFLQALDRYWHNACLKCTSCGSLLADIGPTCYAKNQMILCKNDYSRLFGSSGSCAGCGQTIPPSDFVTRTGGSVFHMKCFQCSKCGAQLNPGARYYLVSGAPVCEEDWQKLVKSSTLVVGAAAGNGGAPVRKGKVGRPRRSRE